MHSRFLSLAYAATMSLACSPDDDGQSTATATATTTATTDPTTTTAPTTDLPTDATSTSTATTDGTAGTTAGTTDGTTGPVDDRLCPEHPATDACCCFAEAEQFEDYTENV